MSHAISITGLTKRFGRFTALDGLDLDVASGETHGFLGPNGAGKSTTIRLLLGLLRSTAGQVTVLGQDPWRDAVALHRRLAYIPGDVTLWPTLTGGECIDLISRMRGVRRAPRREELIERLDLDPTKRAKTYSKGNRQKVALIAAFASPTDLLVLDEPTSGLDPLMEQVFQELVSEAATAGTTILLSSHILAEVEALCERITIIRKGKTVQTGTLAEMRRLTQVKVDAETVEPLRDPRQLGDVRGLQVAGRRVTFSVNPEGLGGAITALTSLGLESLTSQPPSLEELFLEHYELETKSGAALAVSA